MMCCFSCEFVCDTNHFYVKFEVLHIKVIQVTELKLVLYS